MSNSKGDPYLIMEFSQPEMLIENDLSAGDLSDAL